MREPLGTCQVHSAFLRYRKGKMNNLTTQDLVNGFLVFFLISSALIALIYYYFPSNAVKLKGKVFIISQQDPDTTALKIEVFNSDTIAIPKSANFALGVFPSEKLAASKGSADTLITLTWGYVKIGSYQGTANAWTHTCSVKVKTRQQTFRAGILRDAPPQSISRSSHYDTPSNVFGNAGPDVIDFLRKLPFEQRVACPNCGQEIYPSDADWACPECGFPSRKDILKRILKFGALALFYFLIGIFTANNLWICGMAFGLAAVFLWRTLSALVRSLKLERTFPVFQKKVVEQPVTPVEVPLDSQKVDQFYLDTAEAWSAGKLKPF
jgi:hypothetical protein